MSRGDGGRTSPYVRLGDGNVETFGVLHYDVPGRVIMDCRTDCTPSGVGLVLEVGDAIKRGISVICFPVTRVSEI